MRVRHLALEDFRSYAVAEMDLDPGITAFVGANGSGKTNIIEALHLVARGEPIRAHDSDIVRWGAPLAQVRVDVERAEGERRVELLLFNPPEGERRRPRRWRLDGAGKRADDAVGTLTVVAFFPEDVQLLSEAPGARRRYLDAMVSQADRHHRIETREYQRVTEQRNALLRSLRDGGEGAGVARRSPELTYWNEELCRLAGLVAERRAAAVSDLRPAFQRAAMGFGGGEMLNLAYVSQVEGDGALERALGYQRLIEEKGDREIWQATTLVGPHREDLLVTAAGRPLPSFASRGEHRSAVLALKLAEAEWIRGRTGDTPVFLLDDVLSELDPGRREALVHALPRDAQVVVTAALPAGLPPSLTAHATVREVRQTAAGSVIS